SQAVSTIRLLLVRVSPSHRRRLRSARSTSNPYQLAANRQQSCAPTRPSSGFLATLARSQTSLQCAGVASPKRLLFLFSDTGAGHRAAAEAVAAALARRYPDAFQVELFDPMRDHTVLAGRLTALYG